MMGRILGNHLDVLTFKELHFFEQLWDAKLPPRRLSRRRALKLAALLFSIQRDGYFAKRRLEIYQLEAANVVDAAQSSPTAPEVFAEFLRHELDRKGRITACLHTPRNVHYLPHIRHLFPGAKVIAMIRDPRAVLLSQKRRWRRYYESQNNPPLSFLLQALMNYHPITYSLIWKRTIAVADEHAGQPNVRSVQFETLLNEKDKEVEEICQFLGLEFSPAMLQVARVGSSNRPDRPEELGLDSAVAGRWRNEGLNPTEIWLCQRLAAGPLTQHGYVFERTLINPLWLIYYAISWMPKTALAFVLNLNRMRSPVRSLWRRLA